MRWSFLLSLAACSREPEKPGPSDPEPIEDTTSVTDTDTDVPDTDLPPPELVLQGQLVEVSPPTDPWIAGIVASSPFPPGGHVRLYLSRSTTLEGIEAGLVVDGRPGVFTSDGLYGTLRPDETDGSYALSEYEASLFSYFEGDFVRFESAGVAPVEGTALVFQPSYAIVSVPETTALGSDLALDYADQGFSSNVAVVLDASGTVTWSNDPDSLGAMLASNQVEAPTLTIPADAFPTAGDYVVGLAACTPTFPTDLVNLVPELTGIRAGRMAFWKVTAE